MIIKGDIQADSLNVVDSIQMTNGKETKTIMKGYFESDPDSVNFPLWCIFDSDVEIDGELNAKNIICRNGNLILESTEGVKLANGGYASVILDLDDKFRPGSGCNGQILLGSNDHKWKEIWCSQSSINSSSDRNIKNSIKYMNEQDHIGNFFMSLSPCTYKFNDGESGRTHFGFISQDVEQALLENEMTAFDFAGFCKDKNLLDPKDNSSVESQEYSYSLRYGEFIALNTHMIQKCLEKIESLEQEIKELKNNK